MLEMIKNLITSPISTSQQNIGRAGRFAIFQIKLWYHCTKLLRQNRIRQQFGLDKPVWLNSEALKQGDLAEALDTQFSAYLGNLLKGNLGISFASRSPVES